MFEPKLIDDSSASWTAGKTGLDQNPSLITPGFEAFANSGTNSNQLLQSSFDLQAIEQRANEIKSGMLKASELKSSTFNRNVDITGLSVDGIWANKGLSEANNDSLTNQQAGGGDLNNMRVSGEYAPNQVIVKFKNEVSAAIVSTIKSQLKASVVYNKGLNGAELWQIRGTDVAAAIAALSKNPNIKYAEPNYIVSNAATPNDPSFSQLWGLNNTGQTGGTADADIDAPEAWNIQTGGNVVVGVIDTGVDYNHQDLVGNIWTNPGEIAGDGIDNDSNGYVDDIRGYDFVNNDADPMDDHGHGTHVAGTIAGRGNNGVGVTGVSWSSKIVPLKFLSASGSGYLSDAVRAINYATQKGVKITNNSWGGGGFSQTLFDAINAAKNAGSLFIAAAGNDYGNDNDAQPHYPSSYNLDNIISVAATNDTDTIAYFSNYGATSVDLGAPGENILSSTPGNTYDTYSGTSMATPHVSGVASLLLAQNPNMTYAQVKERLLGTGDVVSSLTGKTVTGRRLNAYNALTNTVPATPGIYGTVWNDVNSNGIRDTGEAGLQNWTVYQDSNNNGVLDPAIPGTVKNSTDIPKPINGSTFTSDLIVSGLSGTIGDLNVKLDITHPWVADVDAFLISPTGTRIELFTFVGGSGDNFSNTILDDEATTSITLGAAPFTGSFKPEGLLSAVDGQNPNGTWKLEITDTFPFADDGTLNSWSLTFNSASGEASTATAANGAYSFTNLNPGNYTIREVVQSGWTRTAPSTGFYTVPYNAGDVVTNRDFGNVSATLPVITVTATDASAAETVAGQAANPGLYTFTRTGSTTSALTVNYAMSGTATNGTDYSNVGTSVSFAAGQSSVTRSVTVIDDTLLETNETAILTIAANAGYTIGGTGNATVTIADNDGTLPVVSIAASDATAAETPSGQVANQGRYTLTRTGSTTSALTVNYTVGGTATNGTDYQALGGSITFAAGQTSVNLPVKVTNDNLVEANETVAVTLSANSAYSIGTASATVTIADNDIGTNQTINGSLSTTDLANPTRIGTFMDDYQLTGISAGQNVRINLNSSTFDTYLQVVDAITGQVILENDDASGSNTNSQIVFTAQSDKNYLLRVTSYSNEVGNYSLITSPVTISSPGSNTSLSTLEPQLKPLEASLFGNDNLFSVVSARKTAAAQKQDTKEQEAWWKQLRNALSRNK
ncbi:MAG: S8 family serine peptidase [Crinalium sp.]